LSNSLEKEHQFGLDVLRFHGCSLCPVERFYRPTIRAVFLERNTVWTDFDIWGATAACFWQLLIDVIDAAFPTLPGDCSS
jgi:hypothetical protein